MKALSVRQPWAYAIVHLGKRIENRTWSTRFRGEFLVHAAKGCGRFEYLEAARWMVLRGYARHELFPRQGNKHLPLLPPLDELPRGGFVARARLVTVLRTSASPSRRWHMAGQYGYVLEDVEPVAFERVDGCMGFFDADAARARTWPLRNMLDELTRGGSP